MDDSLSALTIAEARHGLRAGTFSARELVAAVADAIAACDGDLGAYLHTDLDGALDAADRADPALPLGGIPIALKDVISVKGQPLTCGSRMLDGRYTAPFDATVARKLRDAGAILFGRTNMDEFAMGSSTENSALKITRNPWDRERIPGGSSGGSAVAVAADEAIAALGSDTGGSIRQPAALCGCVGLKPTYGRVSRYGLVAFASSLDQIGPFAKTVEDAAILLDCIAGHDPLDSTSLDEPAGNFSAALTGDISGLRIGLPREYFIDGIDPGVRSAVDDAIARLRSLGAETVEISLPHTEYAVATYYVIATAEASANLARFDGVRYGYRAENPSDLLDHYARTRDEGFGSEVKRRILLGTYVLSSGYYDAYYLRAQKVRTLIRRDFAEAFQSVDIIASPTTPTPAFPIGERTDDPLHMYLGDIFTIAANLSGIPGISIPCGFAGNMPVGLQFLGPPLREAAILNAAHAFEAAAAEPRRRPPVCSG